MTAGWVLVILWILVIALAVLVLVLIRMLTTPRPVAAPRWRDGHDLHVIDGEHGTVTVHRVTRETTTP